MSQIKIIIKSTSVTRFPRTQRERKIALSNYFKKINAIDSGIVAISSSEQDPAKAEGFVAVESVEEDDTVAIAGVTLTAKDEPAGANEFTVESTDSAQAITLADYINSHGVISQYVRAEASGNRVNLTAKDFGQLGNLVTLAGSDTITPSGASLAGGQ